MSMTDPIADFLTRIRNGIQAAHEDVVIPNSRLKAEMARILREQGYIEGFEVRPAEGGAAGDRIHIRLKYTDNRTSVISGQAGLPPGAADVRRRQARPEGPGRHGHDDRVDLPGRHDRPRCAQGGRRRRGRGPGLVTAS